MGRVPGLPPPVLKIEKNGFSYGKNHICRKLWFLLRGLLCLASVCPVVM